MCDLIHALKGDLQPTSKAQKGTNGPESGLQIASLILEYVRLVISAGQPKTDFPSADGQKIVTETVYL